MPGDESANNPIGDGVEALNDLAASEVSKAINDVVDQVQGDITEVQRLIEMARGSEVRTNLPMFRTLINECKRGFAASVTTYPPWCQLTPTSCHNGDSRRTR